MRTLKTALQVVAAVALLGALAGPAHGALWLELEPTSATPASRVMGRTGGEGAFPSGSGRTFDLFLFSRGLSEQVWSRNEDGVIELPDEPPSAAVPLAELEVDADGNGFTEFVVPPVDPGEYVIVLHCADCGFRPGALAPMAELTVEASDQRDSLARTGMGAGLLLVAAGVVVAAGVPVALHSRREAARK